MTDQLMEVQDKLARGSESQTEECAGRCGRGEELQVQAERLAESGGDLKRTEQL
ncbi:MAG: hypothetical protein R3C19_10895 [Planctomycetaceae bacterium]